MSILVFFILGIPLAFVADRLILRFDRPDEEEAAAPDAVEVEDGAAEAAPPRIEVKQLPWQAAPWSHRLRRGVVLLLPPLTAVAGWRFDPVDAIAVSLLMAGLLICTATDLLRYRVPNAITYPGTLLALSAALLLAPEWTDLLSAALAAALAGLVFLVMAIATRGGLGLGDVKLATLIGAALGLQSTYEALALGIIAGGVIILTLYVLRFIGRRQAVPYAPFLALAAVAVVLLQGPVFAPL